jgi:type IV pilus assembly protein PilA
MNLVRNRLSGADRDAGFTLIELLIVMLILGLLASIAMPAFFNQRSKAGDAKAKQMAHTAQVAMETCNVGNGGIYSTTACNLAGLQAIEPTIPGTGVTVEPNVPASGYTVKVTASGGNTYSIKRETTGLLAFKCTVASSNRGGCPGTGTAEGSWGS